MIHSDTLLANLLEAIPDRVWLKDVNGVHLTCNAAFAANFGMTVAQVIGTDDVTLVGPEQAKEFAKTDQLAMRAGRPITFEGPMPSPIHTDTTLYEAVKTAVQDAHGNTIGVMGMARNIQQRKYAELLLRDTTEQLELALIGSDLGRWDHDMTEEKGYYLDERSCDMLGRDPRECHFGRAWGHLMHPDDLPSALRALRTHLSGGSATFEAEYRIRHVDGRWIWYSSRGKIVQADQSGKPLRMVGTLMDISQRKQVENQLQSTQAELQATLKALPDLLFEFSEDGHYRAIHIQDPADLLQPVKFQINKKVSDVLPREAADVIMAALHEARDAGRSSGKQYPLELPHGPQWYELSVAPKPTQPGEELRLIAIARNVTERKMAEEAIQQMAFHDSLTGLPNRRLLTNRLEHAVGASQRHRQYAALLFIDLDKFKALNDTHGHDVGDLLLQEVGRRLQQSIRAIDTAARLGGDEFVVLIHELSTDRDDARLHAATVGHKILASLNEPYTLKDQPHSITPSIGATLFNGDQTYPSNLLKEADTAMYQAKAAGRNTLCFYEKIELSRP